MTEHVTPNFIQRSDHTFDVVDHKVAESEFFLQKMFATSISFDFNCYLSAYLSCSRTITLALQRFTRIPGFLEWYRPHSERLKASPASRMFLDLRNEHVHGGVCPVSGSSHTLERSTFFLRGSHQKHEVDDLATAARDYFVALLEVVYDCYVVMGSHIDPQQYFTAENFAKSGRGIDDAEIEVWGWIRSTWVDEGWSDEDRWHELRGHVDECHINHLFYSYLGKVTPQPVLPDYLEEVEPTPEDRGWVHVPAGRDRGSTTP